MLLSCVLSLVRFSRLLAILAVLGWATNSNASAASPWRTIAGTGHSGFGGNSYEHLVQAFSVETRLNSPWGLALDEAMHRLYFADMLNHVVRNVDLQTGLLETIGGTGDAGGPEADELGLPAVRARMNSPTGLVFDHIRRILYVSDTGNHLVRAIGLKEDRVYQAEHALVPSEGELRAHLPCVGVNGTTGPLLLGSAYCAGSTGEGYARYARLIDDFIEFHVAAPHGQDVYELRFRYADRYGGALHASGGRRLRLIVNGEVVAHDLAFKPTGSSQDGRRSTFGWVVASAALQVGDNVVRLQVTGHGGPLVDLLYVLPSRASIWSVAGTGSPGAANDLDAPRPALSSPLRTPLGLAIDEVGQLLYIADSDNGCVRRLHIVAGTISTLAGGAVRSSSKDGETAREGSLLRPTGLALDAAKEYLYIVDALQHRVRRVDLTTRLTIGGTISTVCGFGPQQAPFDLLLREPQDVVIDGGSLYISDSAHGRIRMVQNVSEGMCPHPEVSRLECAHEGVSANVCAALGCCYDASHPDCLSQLNQDGRANPGFQPLDVLTKVDGAAQSPPISFVTGRSGRCCYPKLRELLSLEVLDGPQALVLDTRNGGTLYVSQPKRHRIVRLLLGEGRCGAGAMLC